MTLSAFKQYFDALMSSDKIHSTRLRTLLDLCNQPRHDLHAPDWKKKIEELVLVEAKALA